ncbi:methanol O-anthraniloyltransferase [Bertholletia excelsa]
MVSRREPELVRPARPTPLETKRLSDIDDQESLRFHFPLIMFYRNNPLMEGVDPVAVIREALAKALVYYYPLAGRLVEGDNRKLMVECNGEGVLFLEASADVRLDQLGDTILPPCPYWEDLLYNVPGSGGIVGCPLMLVQVTRLKCGGFVLATRLNHTIGDAGGLAKFLNAVAEIAHGASTPSDPPVWQRDLLNARNPPQITCTHNEYTELADNDQSGIFNNKNTIIKSFFFGPEELKVMRKHLPPHLGSSHFDLVTAAIWRSRTTALRPAPDDFVFLTFLFNVRGKAGLGLSSGYYGNAVACPAAVAKAKTLCSSPLGYAVQLLQQAKAKVNVEYVRSVADYLVVRRRPPFVKKWNYVVSDISRLGLRELDLGWGKPVYGGTVGISGSPIYPTSLCARCKNWKGEEGLLVPISLPESAMERFQKELSKLLTQEPVDGSNDGDPIVVTSRL